MGASSLFENLSERKYSEISQYAKSKISYSKAIDHEFRLEKKIYELLSAGKSNHDIFSELKVLYPKPKQLKTLILDLSNKLKEEAVKLAKKNVTIKKMAKKAKRIALIERTRKRRMEDYG